MLKKTLAFLLTAGVLLAGIGPAFADDAVIAAPTASAVLVDGENVVFDAYTIAGNNYFKLRDLAYLLSGTDKQFDVTWDGAQNAILLTSGAPYTIVGGEMTAKGAGDKTAVPNRSALYLDGEAVSFTAYTIESNNYFKLRDIGAAFDFGVEWDGAHNAVLIDTTQGYEEYPLREEFSLIDGRLTLTMPAGTVDSAIQDSIMSAPASSREETRLYFEQNGAKLVAYAYEFFRYSGGSLLGDARYLTGDPDGGYTLSDEIALGDASMVRITPNEVDPTAEAIYLQGALVKMPDNTLVYLVLYADPAMYATGRACLDLATRVMDTLRIGERRLETASHTESLWGHTVTLADGYIMIANRGWDFDVYYLTKLVALEAEGQPVMGIYIGWYPSGGGAPGGAYETVSDTILGQEIEWVAYTANGVLRREAVLPLPHVQDEPVMHIFLSAGDEAELEIMLTMARSLEIAP